jgi:hypothetical protein
MRISETIANTAINPKPKKKKNAQKVARQRPGVAVRSTPIKLMDG